MNMTNTTGHWLRQLWLALALMWGVLAGAQAADFLPVDEAFRLEVAPAQDGGIALAFKLADKIHLYRDRMSVETDPASVGTSAPQWPKGVMKYDEGFGKEVEVYYGDVQAQVSLPAATATGTPVSLAIGYQGWVGCEYKPKTTTAAGLGWARKYGIAA